MVRVPAGRLNVFFPPEGCSWRIPTTCLSPGDYSTQAMLVCVWSRLSNRRLGTERPLALCLAPLSTASSSSRPVNNCGPFSPLSTEYDGSGKRTWMGRVQAASRIPINCGATWSNGPSSSTSDGISAHDIDPFHRARREVRVMARPRLVRNRV